MIPVLYLPEAEPEALLDVNSVPIHDVNDEPIYVLGDISSPRSFASNGVGALTDCIFYEVTEERNGEYELVMEYPMTGAHYEDIAERYIIMAKPNYQDDPQPFRIYRIKKAIEGVIRIYAQHLSYDLSGVPVLPFTATSASAACSGLSTNAAFASPFTINTTVTTVADFAVTEPASIRSWFGGREGSLIDVYGGEWAYDKYTCTLKSARGQDRGVKIRYGKNLIDLKQEKEISNMWTGVLPYWKDQESGNTVRAGIINVAGNFDFRRVLCLDLTDDFDERPTPMQLTARAQTYITANNIGVPKVSLTVDWAQTNERVDLCDTVEIIFERLGISAKAKCIRATWDGLKERYTSLEFGDAQVNITDTIAGLQEQEKKTKTSISETMLQAIANATAQITGNEGGYVVMHDGDGDGYPDELLIMDSDSVETATKVWRWNKSGLGYSSTGYNGTYGLAMTADGQIVADFITTGSLNADRISGGTITGVKMNNGSGTFQVDESGNVTANSLTSSNATITGGDITITTQNLSSGIHLRNQNNPDNKVDIGSYLLTKETASGKWQWVGLNLSAVDSSNNTLLMFDGSTGAITCKAFSCDAGFLMLDHGHIGSASLDNYKTAGVGYAPSTAGNKPSSTSGTFVVLASASSGVLQIFSNNATTPTTYIRYYRGSNGWTSWLQMT